ncbi:MAG: bifunctional demethylmenaquinone methyltransferase/2-methoxy-6-polyprenyl-1,4-benzoquinol methylase UbiE [Candidatus Acidiferrales bacterium]
MPDAAAVKGTRPEGTRSDEGASRSVREMFTKIAPRYDLLNHLLSLQFDRLWRARVTRLLRPILARPEAKVLDLCCGTGDLALSLARAGKARVIGADFAHPMLIRANEKSAVARASSNSTQMHAVGFLEADALGLPFADASFDLITTAFGFRNLVDYEAGLREIRRVLKPRGTLAILEFTEPPDNPFGNAYRWYFRKILPRIGAFVSGDRDAYTYLPASVSRFFAPQELASLMKSAGYSEVDFCIWTLGAVALHTAVRPS